MATRRKSRWSRINWQLWLTRVIAGGMAVVSGWASYKNTTATALMGHSDGLTAHLLGALPDLMMALSLVKISTVQPGFKVSRWVWSAFLFGLLVSVASNEVAKWDTNLIGRAEGLALPVFVMLAVETVRQSGKRVRRSRPVKAPQRVREPRTAREGVRVQGVPVAS